MAAVDKMYMNKKEFFEYCLWLANKHTLPYVKLVQPIAIPYQSGDYFITNYPEDIDAYLWDNCDLEFIQKRLHEQYGDTFPKGVKR